MGHEVAHSLVARLNGVQEAAGSTPVTRTNKRIANVVLFLFYLKIGRIEPAASPKSAKPIFYIIAASQRKLNCKAIRGCAVGSTPVTRTKKSRSSSMVWIFYFVWIEVEPCGLL